MKERIKKIRIDAGESQAAMGERLGVAQRTIAGWEKGTRQPNADMIVKIAETYQITTDYLLGRTDIPNMYAQGVASVNGEEWDIYSENKNLSPDEREQVERQIHGAMEDDQRFILQDSSPESLEELVRRIAEQVYQERDKQNESDSK